MAEKCNSRELLQMFQELHNYYMELSRGNESEIIAIIREWNFTREKWLAADIERHNLEVMNQQLQTDIERERNDKKTLNASLLEARSQVAAGLVKVRTLEAERTQMSETMDLLREICKDIDLHAGESGWSESTKLKLREIHSRCTSVQSRTTNVDRGSTFSIISDDDVSYDRTDDDLELQDQCGLADSSVLRNGARWVRGDILPTSRKRTTNLLQPTGDLPTEEFSLSHNKKSRDGPVANFHPSKTTAVATTRRSSGMNRSISEPQLPETKTTTPRSILKSCEYPNAFPLRAVTSSTSLNARCHNWLSNTIFTQRDYCNECMKKGEKFGKLKFGHKAFRCLDCQMTVCADCRIEAPLPCIPKSTTPRKHRGMLADFAPTMPPMIPHIVIHLINEIEHRGMTEVGMYRVPGSESAVVKLTEDFLWGRSIPNLKNVEDIHVLTGSLKKFLLWLKEPVIPHSSWHDFVRSSENSDAVKREEELVRSVSELPAPNRDTLAYLMLHVIKVVQAQNLTKMSSEAIATVFGPSIVGNSSEKPNPDKLHAEISKQQRVILALLDLSVDYWNSCINLSDVIPLFSPKTPEPTPAPQNMLGTISQPNTPATLKMTPIFGSMSTSVKSKTKSQRKYFQPPWK